MFSSISQVWLWVLVTLTVFIVRTSSTTESDLEVLVDQCCPIGHEWYLQSGGLCVAYSSPVLGVTDQISCRSVIQVCCLEKYREKQCSDGKKDAQLQRICPGLHLQDSSDEKAECCHCCKLGMVAGEGLGDCNALSETLPECGATYRECCLKVKEETGQNSEEVEEEEVDGSEIEVSSPPPTSRPPVIPPLTAQPPGDQEITGLCARFPGQLCAHLCIDESQDQYKCECFPGFDLMGDLRTCKQQSVGNRCDINNPCLHQCVDTGVAIQCRCFEGYMLDIDGKSCTDINECVIGTHTCSRTQSCINLPGSFKCEGPSGNSGGSQRDDRRTVLQCQVGFVWNSITHQCEDVNECALNRDSCMEGQVCENTLGSYHCRRSISCGTGYTLDRNTQQCIDDDECSLGTHNCGPARQCRNTLGSFRCETKDCPLGYKLEFATGQCKAVVCNRGLKPDRAGNCVDINECIEQPSVCRATQECRNTIGSYICRNLINCGPGYELNDLGTQCVDVDECERGTHDCHGQGQQCINRHGTYICRCPEGYQMDQQLRRCEDIDECQRFSGTVCAQNSNCQNTLGSFRCECKEGFEMDVTGRRCKDVDECMSVGRCLHSCRNTWGSYTCMCFDGYKLGSDGRTCEDIDECAVYSQQGGQLCVGLCENTDGSYICSCPDGYRMLGDGRTCQDIDECALRTANCNGQNDMCINTRGGYKCQTETCPGGFVRVPSRSNRHNNIRCQRQTFVCAQGDTECLYAPLSYSVNFMTFPSKINVPADLFTMRGPFSPYRRLEFALRLVSAEDPVTGVTRVSRDFFNLRTQGRNEAVVELLEQIPGPQDVELELKMNIYSKEFGGARQPHSGTQSSDDVFFGTAVAKIHIFVTENTW